MYQSSDGTQIIAKCGYCKCGGFRNAQPFREYILILRECCVIIKTEVINLNGMTAERAEEFLKQYRRLEGLLERRYAGKKTEHSSVVREYMFDPDSVPYRTQLDLCREIRNLLSHTSDDAGEPVVDPSQSILDTLKRIIEHVERPILAVECGTPGEKIVFAHPNERVTEVIRRMRKMGYSHVPVKEGKRITGVFSSAALFAYLDRNGFCGTGNDMRIADLDTAVEFDHDRSEKYVFMPQEATILAVRDAFRKHNERNSRVAAVFITKDGESSQEILAMLTPWDVLREDADGSREEL